MDLYDIAIARKLAGGSGGGGGGSSDFTTCTMTVTGVDPIYAAIPVLFMGTYLIVSDSMDFTIPAGESYQVPLYQGSLVVYASHLAGTVIEGNAQIVDGALIITGDFTIGYK